MPSSKSSKHEVVLQPQQLPGQIKKFSSSNGAGRGGMNKELPGKDGEREGRPRMGSTLSIRDANARAGSKSSVSSQEGDTYHTAAKDSRELKKITIKSKVYRNSTKSYSNKENLPSVVNQEQIEKPQIFISTEDNGASPDLKDTKGMDLVDSLEAEIFEDALQELPEGVVNVLIDEGLYEYSQEVYIYLRGMEDEQNIPADFIDSGSVDGNMRMILVDWMIQVQHHLKLSQESLYLAVGILDTVLARRDVDSDKLQLVGITALLMATKLEEYYPAEISKLLHLTENSYTRKELLRMERIIFQVLQFKVYIPSPQVYLLRYVRAALRGNDEMFYKTCTYILDSHLVLSTHSSRSPAVLAASATLLACLLYQLSSDTSSRPDPGDVWSPTLVYYSNLQPGDLVSASKEMVRQMIMGCSDNYKYQAAFHKYKSSSQHQRLSEQKHLQVEVLKSALRMLTAWETS